jgi:uncharacterized protein (TIGR03435 family)
MRRTMLPLTIFLALTTAYFFAQSAPVPVFDVSVIRPTSALSNDRSHIWSAPNDGDYKAQNVTLKQLIQSSFNIPASRILEGPSWLGSTKFDLEARADPTIDAQLKALPQDEARQQKRTMQQALLADRFHLVTHTETRELPIYALVVAKSGLVNLTKANGTTINTGNNHLSIEGGDNTMTLLADALSQTVGRVVVDKTGITGRYLVTLKWTPDGVPPSEKPDAPPSIFTALQEQLGLKLEPQKAPVPVLVVDHAEMPSDN